VDLIRLDRSDLDDLRYFIRYVDEKGMTVEEVNEVLYYLGDKYDFDPLEHKINLMTGIVVPKQPYANSPPLAQKAREAPQVREPPSPRGPLDAATPAQAAEAWRLAQEGADELRTYRIVGCAGSREEPEECVPGDYAKELEEWILGNNLSYLEARRMVASLELKKRMSELHPDRGRAPSSGKLAEFEDWISYRGLNYFKVRMMIARLGQDEERERLVAAVA
jgi:hypothetical protein